jgi:hypothetical protein
MKCFVQFTATMFCFLAILAGCHKPYQTPFISPSDQSFQGIETLLSESGAISLISIHGMCHHGTEWIKGNRDRFGEVLGMAGDEVQIMYDGGVAGVKAYQTNLRRGTDQMVRIYSILYSDVTLPEKQRELCRDVSQKTDICSVIDYKRTRASFNEALINQLINDCLADVAVYLGPTGEKIRSGVRDAFRAVMADIRNDPKLSRGPLVFLSESLGSKVLGDSLLCAPADFVSSLQPELARTSLIILGANQIPLLNLGFKESPCDTQNLYLRLRSTGARLPQPGERKGGLSGFLDIIKAAQAQAARRKSSTPETLREEPPVSFVVVAFTDPNDLFGYEILSADLGYLPVVNIIVSNASTWFGFIENPLEAHQGLRENRAVFELLMHGYAPDQD